MKTIDAEELATDLSRLLAEVANGETLTITRQGVAVAELIPPRNGTKPDVTDAVERWIAYRDKHNITLGGLSIRQMIDEGRRY